MLKKVTMRLAIVAMTELALSGTAFSAQGGAMTEVGTPRAQTLHHRRSLRGRHAAAVPAVQPQGACDRRLG